MFGESWVLMQGHRCYMSFNVGVKLPEMALGGG